MTINRSKLYDLASDFFTDKSSAIMKLTPSAAIDVCKNALNHDLMVVRIEGGIWHYPGFEARIDCIWDSKKELPVEYSQIEGNNNDAVKFILSESKIHDVFIITVIPVNKNNIANTF